LNEPANYQHKMSQKYYKIDTDRTIPFIVGPTAVGKTGIAIELAQQMDGEIISVDSRQIYRKLDIGTAKPDRDECKKVEHHLIDIVDPGQRISAGKYREMALKKVEELLGQDKLPIFVGGSGMYIRAVTQGFFQGSKTDPEVRQQVKEELKGKGKEALYQRLKKLDPQYAEKIHVNDTKRITRALEIYRINGKPPTELYREQKKNPPFPHIIIGLKMDRKKLYRKINSRVDEMIEEGLIEEVERLRKQGYKEALGEIKTVGYYELSLYFDGEIGKEEAINKIKQNTRQYAKRQLSWFRNQAETIWIDITNRSKQEVVAEILKLYQGAHEQ